MDLLGPMLPKRYAPLRPNGGGLQNVYLTTLSDQFAEALIGLVGSQARDLIRNTQVASDTSIAPAVGLLEWEEHVLNEVQRDPTLPETERLAVVLARRGQGLFKHRVMKLEHACRITGVNRPEHLRASHCKPWRDATNEERLDGENGLLLTPTMDHLFDRGFIGFEDSGRVIVSPVVHRESLVRMGLDPQKLPNVGQFSSGQRKYLEFHRNSVLLRSTFLKAE